MILGQRSYPSQAPIYGARLDDQITNFGVGPTPTMNRNNLRSSPLKQASSKVQTFPKSQVFFTYGRNQQKLKHPLHNTLVAKQPPSQKASQWEIKYFQLERKMNQFIEMHRQEVQDLMQDKADLEIQLKSLLHLKNTEDQNQNTIRELYANMGELSKYNNELKNQNQMLQEALEKYRFELVSMQANLSSEKLSPQRTRKHKITQEEFQHRLRRIKAEYERMQSKMEATIESKTKQNSELLSRLLTIEQKQRVASKNKDKLEQILQDKKAELKEIKESMERMQNGKQSEFSLFYQQKIQQVNKIAREQAQRIKKIQSEKKDLQQKLNTYQDSYVSEEKLKALKKQIADQSNKMLEDGGAVYQEFTGSLSTYDNSPIFEQSLIYQLKKDNQKLKKMVCKSNPDPRNMFIQNMYNNNISKLHLSQLPQKLCGDLKSLIVETFTKIQVLINDLKINEVNSDKGADLKQERHTRKINTNRKSKAHETELNKQVISELQILELYIVDLNDACNNLMSSIEKYEQIQPSILRMNRNIEQKRQILEQMMPKDTENLQFYQNKITDLQGQVHQLQQLNKFYMLKLSNSTSSEQKPNLQFWKQQNQTLKKTLLEKQNYQRMLIKKIKQAESREKNLVQKCRQQEQQIQMLNKIINEKEKQIEGLARITKNTRQISISKDCMERELSIHTHRIETLNNKMQELMRSLAGKQLEIDSLNAQMKGMGKTKN